MRERGAARVSRATRLLMVNQFTINVGFYMLMPYLAAHLSGDLGLSLWVTGLVLGARNLFQQGLFLVGGGLADRLGYKPMILTGLALRTAGFALLGLAESVPVLFAASALTGLAGAFFNPAARAYLAQEAGERKVEAFALFNVFYQSGILIGPLIGLALNGLAFRVTCLTAAALFAVLSLAQARALPARRGSRAGAEGSVWSDWRAALGDRSFLLFAGAMSGSYVLGFQVYLSLPLAAPGYATWIFVLSGAMAMLGQVKLTARLSERWAPGSALSRGLAVMGAAFLLPAVVPGAAGVLAATALLTLGTMIVYPFEMAAIARFAGDRVGTYYGLYSTISGLGVAVGNALTGAAMESGLAWWGLAGFGICCAAAVKGLCRSGREISTAGVTGS
ncbi:MFS transporter [Nonomuraea sp. NBC_01738]|uniref:MFS transporter n=1 Tax=Nonomuraea sp. NBC_01738 TaxID=2976003 RepID=UPI002E0DED1A|nr:MFS transporter [Nonomuraea sp. NBC_01738]